MTDLLKMKVVQLNWLKQFKKIMFQVQTYNDEERQIDGDQLVASSTVLVQQ